MQLPDQKNGILLQKYHFAPKSKTIVVLRSRSRAHMVHDMTWQQNYPPNIEIVAVSPPRLGVH